MSRSTQKLLIATVCVLAALCIALLIVQAYLYQMSGHHTDAITSMQNLNVTTLELLQKETKILRDKIGRANLLMAVMTGAGLFGVFAYARQTRQDSDRATRIAEKRLRTLETRITALESKRD